VESPSHTCAWGTADSWGRVASQGAGLAALKTSMGGTVGGLLWRGVWAVRTHRTWQDLTGVSFKPGGPSHLLLPRLQRCLETHRW
jgi:hypothetical protein